MKMTKFGRHEVRLLQSELQAALDTICASHGIPSPALEIRPGVGGHFCRIMKADIRIEAPVAVAVQRMPVDTSGVDPNLLAAMKRYGIASHVNRNGDRLTGYHPNRTVNCFSYQGRKGGRWIGSPDQMQARFGRAE